MTETRLDLHLPLVEQDTIEWSPWWANTPQVPEPGESERTWYHLILAGAVLMIASGVALVLIGLWIGG